MTVDRMSLKSAASTSMLANASTVVTDDSWSASAGISRARLSLRTAWSSASSRPSLRRAFIWCASVVSSQATPSSVPK